MNKKTKNKPISVIIPCYNVEEFLPNLFMMLVNQTLQNYELIFINDGSTDSTEYLIKDFVSQNPQTKFINLPCNIGAGNARNLGINNSTGDYIIFIDADDSFSNELLEKTYICALKNNVDICFFKTNCYNYETKRLFLTDIGWLWMEPYPINTVFTPKDIKNNLFTFCRGSLWNKIFRRSLIQKHNLCFLNLPKHNDSYFVYTAYLMAKKMYIMDTTLMTYVFNRPGSISQIENNSAKTVNIAALSDFMKNNGLYDEYKLSLAKYIDTY